VALGRWDVLPELDDSGLPIAGGLHQLAYLPLLARVQAGRGDAPSLTRTLALAVEREGSSNIEYAASPVVAHAIAVRALGRDREALDAALPIATGGAEIPNEDRREALLEAGLSALALDDEATVEVLIAFVAELPPALRTPLLRAAAARFTGLLAARRGDAKVADERLEEAARELRGADAQFVLAQVLLEHAELKHADGRDEEAAPLLAEATAIFTRLRAAPLLERAEQLGIQVPV